jgi:hypothetical protein
MGLHIEVISFHQLEMTQLQYTAAKTASTRHKVSPRPQDDLLSSSRRGRDARSKGQPTMLEEAFLPRHTSGACAGDPATRVLEEHHPAHLQNLHQWGPRPRALGVLTDPAAQKSEKIGSPHPT